MGSGLSSSHRRSTASLHQPPSPAAAAPALVVAADGSLREFAPASSPVSASDVLAGDNAGKFFVCSSDALYFDADVPALGADELLRPGQIYFVLPTEMLGRPLSASDMAALAVRASDALAARSSRAGSGRARRGGGFITKVRVAPAAARDADGEEEVNEKLNQRTLGGFETASWSPARGATKGSAAVMRPPMRRALSTIMEDAD
ncbi:hypothetical protein HU200_058908 [Digitaria exilis]|uniref:Uncharacterized protein n=1 Tax=Digitaria exilis TaxID=1010633 RepID=A0A835AEF4_9POAL|nr:hypothetical protein HU200_058908 [Digitaria exilis]